MRFASIVGACAALSCAVPASAAIFTLTSEGKVTSTQFSGERDSTLTVAYDDVANTISFALSDIYFVQFYGTFGNFVQYSANDAGGSAIGGDTAYHMPFLRYATANWTNVEGGEPIVAAYTDIHYERNAFPDVIYRFNSNARPAPGPAVPEPATWAMLILGFGLAGVVARRRAGYSGLIVRDRATSNVAPALSVIRSTQE